LQRSTETDVAFDGDGHRHVDAAAKRHLGERIEKDGKESIVPIRFPSESVRSVNENAGADEEGVDDGQSEEESVESGASHLGHGQHPNGKQVSNLRSKFFQFN